MMTDMDHEDYRSDSINNDLDPLGPKLLNAADKNDILLMKAKLQKVLDDEKGHKQWRK